METKLFFYNSFTNRQLFHLQNGSRPWHAIIIVSDGSFSYEINQKKYIINKNNVAYFPKDIIFSREIIKSISFHQFGFHYYDDEAYLPAADCGLLNLPEEYVSTFVELLNTLGNTSIKKKKHIYQNIIDQILLANYIYNAQKDTQIPAVDSDVEFVVEYMYSHLNEEIHINELAQQLHLTHTGLIGKFKRMKGCTPNQFLIKIRMNLAKKLILENRMRINEISNTCGYSNAYYFSNAFRAYFGMAPSDYRKKNRYN